MGPVGTLTNRDVYALLVALARQVAEYGEPEPGDLVVEAGFLRPADPDAIGWLLGHGEAPWGRDDPTDGSVPMREVWDVVPLNPDAKLQEIGGEHFQRWENASFRRLDPKFLERAGIIRR